MLCEVKTMKHITENKHLLHRRAIAPTQETGKISWHVVPMQEMSCKTSSLSFLSKQGFAKISQQAKWAQDCQQQSSTKFNKVCPEIAKAVLFPPLCWEALAMEPP